jgi:hypothetical protein
MKSNFINTVEKLYLIIKQISEDKPLMVYEENNKFGAVPTSKYIDIAEFCIKMIGKLIEVAMFAKRISLVAELLINH